MVALHSRLGMLDPRWSCIVGLGLWAGGFKLSLRAIGPHTPRHPETLNPKP